MGVRVLQLHKEGKRDEMKALLTQKKSMEAQMPTRDASPSVGFPVVEALLAQLGVTLPRAAAASVFDDVDVVEDEVRGGDADDDLDMAPLSSVMSPPPQRIVAVAAPPASAPMQAKTGASAGAAKAVPGAAQPAVRVVQDTSFDRQVREQKILETLRQTVDDLQRYSQCVCAVLGARGPEIFCVEYLRGTGMLKMPCDTGKRPRQRF
jgi:hypothetical protein